MVAKPRLIVPVADVFTATPAVPPWIVVDAAPVVEPRMTVLAAASLPIPMVWAAPTIEKLPVPTVIVTAPVFVALPIETAPLPTVDKLVGPGFTTRLLNTAAVPLS